MSETSDDTRYEAGMQVRREVLGDEYVDRAISGAISFGADFQRFVTETAWGAVWARPGLERRTRSLVTISILAALGREQELALHLRASQNVGVPLDDIAEALMHVAVYAGVPAANTAFAIARRELGIVPDATQQAPTEGPVKGAEGTRE